MPVIAVLDLHSNISQRMADAAKALIVERTYPHTDMVHAEAAMLPSAHVLDDFRFDLPLAQVQREDGFLPGRLQSCHVRMYYTSEGKGAKRYRKIGYAEVVFEGGIPRVVKGGVSQGLKDGTAK